jgi:hypothetical protein
MVEGIKKLTYTTLALRGSNVSPMRQPKLPVVVFIVVITETKAHLQLKTVSVIKCVKRIRHIGMEL